MKIFSRSLFLILAFIAGLAALEIAARAVCPPNVFTPLLPLRPYQRLKMSPQIPGLSPSANFTTNTWGFRGDEPPRAWKNHLTIVAVGGSTTLCVFLDDKKTWPSLLQEKLRAVRPDVWVGNGGMDGQSTRAHLIFMREVVSRIKPDMVLVLAGVNDLGFSISEPRRVLGNPYDLARPMNFAEKCWYHSRFCQFLCLWKKILWDKAFVDTPSPKRAYRAAPLSPKPGPLPPNIRPLLPAIDEYRQNVLDIHRIARSLNVRAVFLTQPMLWENNEYWNGRVGTLYWMRKLRRQISAGNMAAFMDYYNKELISLCAENRIPCFDLASEIPHSDVYFYDAVHFTESGARLVAEKVARYLTESGLVAA